MRLTNRQTARRKDRKERKSVRLHNTSLMTKTTFIVETARLNDMPKTSHKIQNFTVKLYANI